MANKNSEVSELLGASWLAHLKVKSWHFAAAAEYRKSCECISQNKYGDEIARLKAAEDMVKKAFGQQKLLRESVINDLKSLQSAIQTNLKRAEKDNDIIYMQPVPSVCSLSPIEAKEMVKLVTPPEVTDPISRMSEKSILGLPLFGRLVPFAVHQAESVYSDRKQNLVKNDIIAKLEELTSTYHRMLQSLNLPGALEALEQPDGLPLSLLIKSKDVQEKGGLVMLQDMLTNNKRLAQCDVSLLDEAFAILDQEVTDDEELRAQFPGQWNLPASESVNKSLVEQGLKLRKALEQARTGDAQVKKKLEDWASLIDLLGADEETLEHAIPENVSSLKGTSAAVVNDLRSLLNDGEQLIKERQAKIQEVKKTADLDDISSVLRKEAAKLQSSIKIEPAHFEDLFAKQMKQYDVYLSAVEEEIELQETLLHHIRDANKAFLHVRNQSNGLNPERLKVVQNLELGHAKFHEILVNLQQGEKFYLDLEKLLKELKANCQQYSVSRRRDAAQHADNLAAYMENLSLSDAGPSPSNTSVAGSGWNTNTASSKYAEVYGQPPSNQYPNQRTQQSSSLQHSQTRPPPGTPSGQWTKQHGIRFGGKTTGN